MNDQAMTMDGQAASYFAQHRAGQSQNARIPDFVSPAKRTLWIAGAVFALTCTLGLTANHWLHSMGWSALAVHPVWVALLWAGAVSAILSVWPMHSRAKSTAHKTSDQKVSLFLGTAKGTLEKRNHATAALPGQDVVLHLNDACMNIVMMGGIGSGKTTRMMYPLLLQLLDQDCGGLIFDIKANYKKAVLSAAKAVGEKGQRVVEIGPGKTHLNLLAGLTPEAAASNLKSALMLVGSGQAESPIWVNTAGDWLQSGLGVLSFTEHYSLFGLYQYLFNPEFHADIDAEVEYLMDETLDDANAALAKSYLDYQNNVFAQFDTRFVADVRATVAQILGPFQHPDLISAFCDVSDKAHMDTMMNDVLNGTVYLVDLPLSTWGLGGKTAYTIMKLRFFTVALARTENIQPSDKPVFFMCDEYQEIISANANALSDLSFWDKSREAKCIGIVSWQGVSSIYASIGSRDVADAILQNFRQRIILRTEDENTLHKIGAVAGSVVVERTSKNKSVSGGMERDYTTSKGSSQQETDKAVIDPQVVRQLGPNQAIALLNIDGYAVDDVLEFTPIYVN